MKRDARSQAAFRNFLCNSLTLTAVLGAASALALSAPAFAASDQMSANSQTSGPSAQDFTKPADEAANWILPAGDYSGNRQIKEPLAKQFTN